MKIAGGVIVLAALAMLGLVLLYDDGGGSEEPPPARVVAKTCRATMSDYEGNKAQRLIACHEALGRPFPKCSDLAHRPGTPPGGPLITTPGLPNSNTTGPSLAYVPPYPPCVFTEG